MFRLPSLLAVTDPGSIAGPWGERLTLVGGLIAILTFGHRRVWEWSYQRREQGEQFAKEKAEMLEQFARERADLIEQITRERSEKELYRDHLFRVSGVISEALPNIETRLRHIEPQGGNR